MGGHVFLRLRWALIWVWAATFLEAAYLTVLFGAQEGTCGGDGGSPRAAAGSQAAHFCSTWINWTDTTDPVSILMYTAMPSLVLGAIGIWRRSRLLLALAAAAEIAFIIWLHHAAVNADLGR